MWTIDDPILSYLLAQGALAGLPDALRYPSKGRHPMFLSLLFNQRQQIGEALWLLHYLHDRAARIGGQVIIHYNHEDAARELRISVHTAWRWLNRLRENGLVETDDSYDGPRPALRVTLLPPALDALGSPPPEPEPALTGTLSATLTAEYATQPAENAGLVFTLAANSGNQDMTPHAQAATLTASSGNQAATDHDHVLIHEDSLLREDHDRSRAKQKGPDALTATEAKPLSTVSENVPAKRKAADPVAVFAQRRGWVAELPEDAGLLTRLTVLMGGSEREANRLLGIDAKRSRPILDRCQCRLDALCDFVAAQGHNPASYLFCILEGKNRRTGQTVPLEDSMYRLLDVDCHCLRKAERTAAFLAQRDRAYNALALDEAAAQEDAASESEPAPAPAPEPVDVRDGVDLFQRFGSRRGRSTPARKTYYPAIGVYA